MAEQPRASLPPAERAAGTAERTPRGALRQRILRWAPWAVALAILAYILSSVPRQALFEAMTSVSPWRLVALMGVTVTSAILVDSLILWFALRAGMPDRSHPYRSVLLVRGTSSLLTLINYGAGQGSIVYLLHRRHQVPLNVGASAVVLANAAFLMALALALGIGLLAGSVPDRIELRVVAWAALAILPVYLAIVVMRPRLLTQRRFVGHLFDVGVGAVARVAGARILHLLVLVTGNWLALRLFGVDVPPDVAIVRLPVMFVIASLPISPSGLGTAQAAAITLFAPYAPGTEEVTRQATVLAYSLTCHTLNMAFLFLTGLVCLRQLQRE